MLNSGKDVLLHPEDRDSTFDRLTPQLDYVKDTEEKLRQETVKITEDEDTQHEQKTAEGSNPIHIDTPLACYVCKNEVTTIHHFYDQVSDLDSPPNIFPDVPHVRRIQSYQEKPNSKLNRQSCPCHVSH